MQYELSLPSCCHCFLVLHLQYFIVLPRVHNEECEMLLRMLLPYDSVTVV